MPEAGHPQPAEIARKEISLLLGLAEQAGVNDARLRHDLRLSENELQEWLGVLPMVLRHLGYLTSRLDRATRPAYA